MTYNRYNNGKIYQITNNLNDMIYIGSTCLPLRKRWYNHKNEMNCGKGSTWRLFQMAAQIGCHGIWRNFSICVRVGIRWLSYFQKFCQNL